MQLLAGFGAILLILILVSANSYYQLTQETSIEDRLFNIRQPTVITAMTLENGLELSLASLRGYIILGNDPTKAVLFKKERSLAWQKIDQSLNQLKRFSKQWRTTKNTVLLKKIKQLINEFRLAQQEVEDLAHTNANIPSYDILLTDAAPLAAKIIESITSLIDQESQLKATSKRKKLLKLLADSRGSFALAMANIRAYLLSGNEHFKTEFFARWRINQQSLEQITAMKTLFSSTQATAWQNYAENREKFTLLPEKMFKSRASKDWNLANYYLSTKAAPKSQAIKANLLKIRQSFASLNKNDVKQLEQKASSTELSLIIASLIAVITGIIIA